MRFPLSCLPTGRRGKLSMGKGDKKTRKGKIQRGSYGVRRLRIKKRPRLENKLDPNKKVKPKP